ncbi:MAG TPA: anthranilate phosphoribosyltransferase, partial [Acidimicrobiia bacterium]|nr:anthranilate phosphoribosyltransferase [Acidimicrobiia bacterium]
RMLRAVLAGEKGPHRDLAVLNAAAALMVAGLAPDLGAGIEVALVSLDTGAAERALETLVRVSQAAHAAEGKA